MWLESGLTFSGFAVFNCLIRGVSASVLSELKASSHDLVSTLCYSCHVAHQVNIISKPALILGPAKGNNGGYERVSPDETHTVIFSENEVGDLSESYDLCIGGDCMEMLQQSSSTLKVIPYVKVFARVAPEQKELIITSFKSVGRVTLIGVFTAAFFLFISHASPLPTLSAERPHPTIFCSYVLLSLLGQFTVHVFFLVSSVKAAEKYMPEECIEPDSEFHPNLVNTVSYMVGMMLQVATFAVKYMGHPFNQSISQNRPFQYALVGAVGFFTVITSDLFRDLNDWLKLVPLPKELRNKLMLWSFLAFLVCYSWERFLRWAFPGKMPAWKKKQRTVTTNAEKKRV
ncbi:putative manganese-transporting ATPase pdr2 [Salvia divinorum]|uniref:Manganese-transporting ATPase pdr2 n=2 Tax=Salvia divinorum TaxID=28513 RepID=A0ABD1FIQ2_SALDI